jgi:hypothetical protein
VSEEPRISVVIPAYNEGVAIFPALDRMFESVRLSPEVLVVVDSDGDSTIGGGVRAEGAAAAQGCQRNFGTIRKSR